MFMLAAAFWPAPDLLSLSITMADPVRDRIRASRASIYSI